MPIDVLIEGFLFYKSTPQKKQTIIKLFDISNEDFINALEILKKRLRLGAIRIIETDEDIQLAICPEMAPIIEVMRKNEFKADISKAGAETLAIILYKAPISRSEIDHIRGVNSSFILRNLLIRGLIEKSNDKNSKQTKFIVTPALLALLGITHKHELPDFAKITDSLEKFEEDFNNKDTI